MAPAMLTFLCIGRLIVQPIGFCGPPGGTTNAENASLDDLFDPQGDVHASAHFQIHHDSAEEDVAALAGQIEETYAMVWNFCVRLNLHPTEPKAAMRVYFFNQPETLTSFCRRRGFSPSNVPGVYDRRANLVACCNLRNFPPIRGIDERITGEERPEQKEHLREERDALVQRFQRLVLRHEAAHQVLQNIGVLPRDADVPPWLNEGLACQFEVTKVDPAGGLPEVNSMRLADLREALNLASSDRRVSDEQIKTALQRNRLVPLSELVGTEDVLNPDTPVAAYRYGQAWGFVFFLSRRHPQGFSAYLRRWAEPRADVPPDRAQRIMEFERHVCPLDDASLRRWLDEVGAW